MKQTVPNFRLDGKRALVTGAGRGIGLAIARAYAEAGAHVTLCARSEPEIASAASDLRGDGLLADILPLDVTDVKSTAAALADLKPFDVFMNNAGMNRPKPMLDVTEDDYDSVMGLNVRAVNQRPRLIPYHRSHKALFYCDEMKIGWGHDRRR